jgi:ribose 5-phosphate isomerase A
MSEFTRDWNSVTTNQELIEKQENIKKAKQLAGYAAVDMYVKSNMVVGLGTGSTAAYAVERVGQKLKSGGIEEILCIPTSVATEEQANSLKIPLTTLDSSPNIAVAIDGADAVDPHTLNLIKGGGGALLREKMVEVRAKQFICIVDHTKLCNEGLGPSFPLPVEITQWCHTHTMRTIEELPELAGCTAQLRKAKNSETETFVTDNGNFIVDLTFTTPIKDVPAAARAIKNIPGVVEHGLFVGMASHCIVANENGTITIMQRESNGKIIIFPKLHRKYFSNRHHLNGEVKRVECEEREYPKDDPKGQYQLWENKMYVKNITQDEL